MLACWRASWGIPACVTVRMILAMPVLFIPSKVMATCKFSLLRLRLSIGIHVVGGIGIGVRDEVGGSVPVELKTRVGIPVVAIGPLRVHLTLDPRAVQRQVARQKEDDEEAREYGKCDDYTARWPARSAQQRCRDHDC